MQARRERRRKKSERERERERERGRDEGGETTMHVVEDARMKGGKGEKKTLSGAMGKERDFSSIVCTAARSSPAPLPVSPSRRTRSCGMN